MLGGPDVRVLLLEKLRELGPVHFVTVPLGHVGLPEDIPLLRDVLKDEEIDHRLRWGEEAIARIEARARIAKILGFDQTPH